LSTVVLVCCCNKHNSERNCAKQKKKVLKQMISAKYVFPFTGGNFTLVCALHSRHRRN
jgi:hypothetical protein